MGKRPTLTVAMLTLYNTSRSAKGPCETCAEFLTVIDLATGQLGILLGKGGVAAPMNEKPRSFLSRVQTGWLFAAPVIGC